MEQGDTHPLAHGVAGLMGVPRPCFRQVIAGGENIVVSVVPVIAESTDDEGGAVGPGLRVLLEV
jgi:hypothetical protein